MKNEQKHLIVISYDAFSMKDWELASIQKNMSKLIHEGTYTNQLNSVYPTLTYVVHTSIVTGTYPSKHGVYHNNPLQPFVPDNLQDWFWYRNDIKVPTIYDIAQESKMTTGAILWPVSGKANITYNIPEIRAIGRENQALKIMKNGSPLYSMSMELKYGKYRKGILQPYLDDFTSMCAVDTIKRKKPNLLLLHMIDLDDAKHAYGTDSKEVKDVIIRMDKRIGEIMEAVEEAGIANNTTYLILGDHGQININYKVRLNILFKNAGLITEKKGVLHWKAYVQSNGGSAYVHLNDTDTATREKVINVLNKAIIDDQYGIERLYDSNDLKNLEANNLADFMIEAKEGYSFDDAMSGPILLSLKDKNMVYATHGFHPDKPNYQCNFLISGKNIKKNHRIGDIQMVDIAPTMAYVLGLNFPICDGKVLDEVFIK